MLGVSVRRFRDIAKARGWIPGGSGGGRTWSRMDVEHEAATRPNKGVCSRFSNTGPSRTVSKPAAAPTTPRPCLRCGETFDSAGPGNRLCRGCRVVAMTMAGDAATIRLSGSRGGYSRNE